MREGRVGMGAVWGWGQHEDKVNMAIRLTWAQGQHGHRVGVSIVCMGTVWGWRAHRVSVAMGSTHP